MFYSCKKILRHNADINIIYGTRSNGKSFAVLQNAVIDFLNGVGGLAYIRRRTSEIKKSLVDKYFRDKNFIKWLDEYTKHEYNNIFYKAGDLFICKTEKGEVIKESVKLFGSAFSLQDAEKEKSLHFEHCYNLLLEEALTRKPYLENECVILENLVSTIQRGECAKLWLVGNTVSRVCPYFSYWGIRNIRTQKPDTIEDYKILIDGENDTKIEKFIAVEFAENLTYTGNSLVVGKARESITGNEWESDDHPTIFFKLEEAEILYECFYEYMNFCFKMLLVFYNDAPYLYIYPYTREFLRVAKNRHIFTQQFETERGRSNKMWLNQHKVMRELLRTNKAVYSDKLCGDEFLQCLKSFNPFRA